MNATVVDIPGIHVNVGIISTEHSPDCYYTIEMKDNHGKKIIVSICFGKIISVTHT